LAFILIEALKPAKEDLAHWALSKSMPTHMPNGESIILNTTIATLMEPQPNLDTQSCPKLF